jgi:hypothetical protein
MGLDAMALEACPLIHDTLDQHPWSQEGAAYGRCRRGRWPFLPGDALVMGAARESDLPLEHGIDEPPHHREPGQGRHPFGCLPPSRPHGRGLLDPAQARCHRAGLCLLCLEPLGIRTPCWPHRGRSDGPPGRLLGGHPGLWVPPEARADRDLGDLRLWRTASPRPLWRNTDRFDLVGPAMGTPRPWLAPTPPLATACGRGQGRLRLGGTGPPPRFHGLDVRGKTLGCLGLGGGLRPRGLGGPRAGVHDQQAERGHGEAPVSVRPGPQAGDTVPGPAPWRRLPWPAWLCEPARPRLLRLAPRLSLLPHGPGARHQGEEPHPPLAAQATRALTIGLASGPHALHSVQAERHTLCNGYGRLRTGAGRALTHAQTEWEPLTAHAEAQEHVLESIAPIFPGPLGRPRRARSCVRASLGLIGPLQGQRRGSLMQPRRREGLDLPGVQRDRTAHAVEMRGTQRLQALPQPVIRE